MFCNKKSSVNVEEEFVNSNFDNPKNEKMHFLILYNKVDFEKKYCIDKTSEQKLENIKKSLPGIVIMLSFDEFNSSEYNIEDTPMPNIIYIKLPFINQYVTPDKYPNKYIQLKNNELKNIFATLGAKSMENI